MADDLKDWQPRPRPGRAPMEGRYVRLEPLSAARHGDGLFEASSVPDIAGRFRYLPDIAPRSRAEFQAWLDHAEASADPLFFAVIDQATGKVAGRQTFLRIEPAHGVIEIGHIYWGPLISRRPAATEALFLFATYAFDELGYRRFEWKCNNLNEPSKRAAERFGFTFEGVFRQHLVVKGEIATRPGTRSSTRNGRRCGGHTKAGSIRPILIAMAVRSAGWKIFGPTPAREGNEHGARPWTYPRPRRRPPPCARPRWWRQGAGACGRLPDSLFHGHRGCGRPPDGFSGAACGRGSHADRLSFARTRVVCLSFGKPGGDGANDLWLRSLEDACRLHERPDGLRDRALDHL